MADPTPTPTTPAPTLIPKPVPATPSVQPQPAKPATPAPDLDKQHASETVEAMTKLFEAAETPAPPKPAEPTQPKEPTKPTPVGVDDFQSKLDELKPAPDAHPNVKKGMDQLKELATTQKKAAEEATAKVKELETKVQEYETKLKENKLPENVEKELEELRAMRREISFQSDPEFKKNYIEPISTAEQDIMSTLQQSGLQDDMAKWIQENGGIIAMSQSTQPAGYDNDPKMTMADYVDKVLLADMPTIMRQRVLGKLAQSADVIAKGKAAIADWQANSKERYEQKMKQMATEFEAGKAEAIASLGDFAKPKTIPADATPEVRAEAEAHNNLLKSAEAKFVEYSQKANGNPKIAAEILVKATQADVIMQDNKAKAELITKLRDELSRIKASGSHSSAGSSSPLPGSSTQSQAGSALLKQSTESALNDHFNRA